MAARRLLWVVPVIVLLAWAGMQALRSAEVDRVLVRAGRTLASWPSGSIPPEESWRPLVQELEHVERLQRANPITQELLGLLAARRPDDFAILRQAPMRYEASLRLRPVSPATWANLAEARYLQGDTSARFEKALVNAARLGPAEPQVQRVVADYGLAVRDDVSPEARDAIDDMVAAGMRRNPLEMLRIAQRRGRLSTACRHLAGLSRQPEPKWTQICHSTEARQ